MKKIYTTVTKDHARRFLLLKQGLAGMHRFHGEKGIVDYVTQAGCIQFDPVDRCGKNAELVLLARVKGFKKNHLSKLLYEKRQLVDYFDKQLSIFSMNDWPCFQRTRQHYAVKSQKHRAVNEAIPRVLSILHNNSGLSSADFDEHEKVSWSWSPTRLARATLESLYSRGSLVIHHKRNSIKYYDLAERHVPALLYHAEDSHATLEDHLAWRLKRRIGSVGLLWNRASDALLGIDGLTAERRKNCFEALLHQKEIHRLSVDGIKEPLYCLSEDLALLTQAAQPNELSQRVELLAPLDNLLWDRKLIHCLFDFHYRWEIYKPQKTRDFGAYVLPILYNEALIGRIEMLLDRQRRCLVVENLWFEDSFQPSKELRRLLKQCLSQHGAFHGCENMEDKTVFKVLK